MPTHSDNATYIAIDFETADYKPDSACAIGMAKGRNGVLVDTFYSLIRPPRKRFYFTHIHGIRWRDVAACPDFAEVWAQAALFCQDADAFVAHNASFDKKVLLGCLQSANLPPVATPFLCTLRLSRKKIQLASHSLHALCTHFNITLNHHHAGSDATACLEIFHLLNALE